MKSTQWHISLAYTHQSLSSVGHWCSYMYYTYKHSRKNSTGMYKHSRKNSADWSGNFTNGVYMLSSGILNETKSSPKSHTTSLPQGVLSADYSNTLRRKIFCRHEIFTVFTVGLISQKYYLRIDHCYTACMCTANICKNKLIHLHVYIAMVHPRIF